MSIAVELLLLSQELVWIDAVPPAKFLADLGPQFALGEGFVAATRLVIEQASKHYAVHFTDGHNIAMLGDQVVE